MGPLGTDGCSRGTLHRPGGSDGHAPAAERRLARGGRAIERAVLESDDQGALDTYGYVSFQGNRIVGNVWKDIGGEAYEGYIAGQAGVRLDDAISGVYVASNVFINAAKGNFGAISYTGLIST